MSMEDSKAKRPGGQAIQSGKHDRADMRGGSED